MKCLNIVFKLFSYWHADTFEEVNHQAVSSEPKLNYISKSHSVMNAADIISLSKCTMDFVFGVVTKSPFACHLPTKITKYLVTL